MSSTLIPRNTLLAACIAKSAHEADAAAGKPTVAEEAIATADGYLSNAVLPTYSELLTALREAKEFIDGHSFVEVSSVTDRKFKAIGASAGALLARHDKTLSGNFGA